MMTHYPHEMSNILPLATTVQQLMFVALAAPLEVSELPLANMGQNASGLSVHLG